MRPLKSMISENEMRFMILKMTNLKNYKIAIMVLLLQAISKKGFWVQIAADEKFKPEAYSSILRI